MSGTAGARAGREHAYEGDDADSGDEAHGIPQHMDVHGRAHARGPLHPAKTGPFFRFMMCCVLLADTFTDLAFWFGVRGIACCSDAAVRRAL